MKKFSRFLVTGLVITLISLSFLVIYDVKNFFDDPGFLWHLKDGKDILQTFSIPYEDNYLSLTRPWISDQWLSDVILYTLYSIGNFKLIFYFFTFLSITFIFFFYRKVILLKFSNSIVSSFVSILVILFCKIHFIARPVFFSFLLIICFLYLLEKFKNINDSKSFLVINLQFFFLFFLYANMHPSFFMAFFIWGVFVLESYIKNYKNFDYKKYIITSFVILFATFINPYFISLHESILFLSNSEYFMGLNEEWQSVKLFSVVGILATLIISSISLSFILSKDYREKVSFTYFICSLVFYYYAMKHLRGVTYFSIISGIPLSALLVKAYSFRISNKICILRLLPKFLKHINLCLKNDKVCYAACFIFAFTLVVSNFQNKSDFKPCINKFPYKIASFINNNKLKGNIIASPDYGGFLSWHLHSVKPVMDDRNTLLGEKAYKDYINAQKSSRNMYYYAIKQDAPLVLVDKNTPKYKSYFKSDAFRVLFKSNKFMLLKVKIFD
ncbi:MAG: hypothetical protein SPJ04_02380 [Bdellovibrionota bacterium]|nr:hypothetical protein [Bdellovibrionota bacterium]